MINRAHFINGLKTLKTYAAPVSTDGFGYLKHITVEFKKDTVILAAGQKTRAARLTLHNPGYSKKGIRVLDIASIDGLIKAIRHPSTHCDLQLDECGISCGNVYLEAIKNTPMNHKKIVNNAGKRITYKLEKKYVLKLVKILKALELLSAADGLTPTRCRMVVNANGICFKSYAKAEHLMSFHLKRSESFVRLDLTFRIEDLKTLCNSFLIGKTLDIFNQNNNGLQPQNFCSRLDENSYFEFVLVPTP